MSTLLNQFEIVYGPFGQSNMHSTLDFCPIPARREVNVPLHKRSKELTVLIHILWLCSFKAPPFAWFKQPHKPFQVHKGNQKPKAWLVEKTPPQLECKKSLYSSSTISPYSYVLTNMFSCYVGQYGIFSTVRW